MDMKRKSDEISMEEMDLETQGYVEYMLNKKIEETIIKMNINKNEIKKLIHQKLSIKDIKEVEYVLNYQPNEYDGINYVDNVEKKLLMKYKNFNLTIKSPKLTWKSKVRYGRCVNFDMIHNETKKGMWND